MQIQHIIVGTRCLLINYIIKHYYNIILLCYVMIV